MLENNAKPNPDILAVVRHGQCFDCHLFNCNETSLNCRHHQIIPHPSQQQSGQWNVRGKRRAQTHTYIYESNDWLLFEKWTNIANTDKSSLILCICHSLANGRPISFYGRMFLAKWIAVVFVFVCVNRWRYTFWMGLTLCVEWYLQSKTGAKHTSEWFTNYTTHNIRIIALRACCYNFGKIE